MSRATICMDGPGLQGTCSVRNSTFPPPLSPGFGEEPAGGQGRDGDGDGDGASSAGQRWNSTGQDLPLGFGFIQKPELL